MAVRQVGGAELGDELATGAVDGPVKIEGQWEGGIDGVGGNVDFTDIVFKRLSPGGDPLPLQAYRTETGGDAHVGGHVVDRQGIGHGEPEAAVAAPTGEEVSLACEGFHRGRGIAELNCLRKFPLDGAAVLRAEGDVEHRRGGKSFLYSKKYKQSKCESISGN